MNIHIYMYIYIYIHTLRPRSGNSSAWVRLHSVLAVLQAPGASNKNGRGAGACGARPRPEEARRGPRRGAKWDMHIAYTYIYIYIYTYI